MKELYDDLCQSRLNEVIQNESCARIFMLYNTYFEKLRKQSGQIASFWMSYIDIVIILLGLIRASREGNWQLHLNAIHSMIPWCFAYDRQNYARYLPIHYAQMTSLPKDHPFSYEHLQQGGLSVQRSEHNPFDQTIEETVNKDTQTPGGTKGFSLKPTTLTKYYVNAEYRSTCLRQLRSIIDQQSSRLSHHDLQPTRIKKDESDVQIVIDLLENSWTNPFSETPGDLAGLANGRVAPSDVTRDLLDAHQLGNAAYEKFQSERIEANPHQFHDRLPKLKLKTFSHLKHQVKSVHKNKETVLKADHKLFGQMVLIANSRNLDIREVLQHPLGPIPWSLANCDGTMKKTNKAVLANRLEEKVSATESVSVPSLTIIDGMSLIHKLPGENRTFSEVSDHLFSLVLQAAGSSEGVDIVFDVYKDQSIKDAERLSRGSSDGVQFTQILPAHRIKNWRQILTSQSSKTQLIKFFAADWRQPRIRERLGSKVLQLTCDEKCFRITHEAAVEVGELKTSQEEADTRIILHAKYASGYKSIILVADDTDILLLCLRFCNDIDPNIYIQRSSKSRIRLIDVKKLASAIGRGVCNSLIGMHSFTGCDTVSSFSGHGKLSALKILIENKKFQDAFARFGQQWTVPDDLFDIPQEFTCRLYSLRSTTCDVNDLRYELFRAKKGAVASGELPPCSDCLCLHVKRANYQAAIWQHCLEKFPRVPNPADGHGWSVDNGDLTGQWMSGSPAPDMVLNCMSCNCKRDCQGSS